MQSRWLSVKSAHDLDRGWIEGGKAAHNPARAKTGATRNQVGPKLDQPVASAEAKIRAKRKIAIPWLWIASIAAK